MKLSQVFLLVLVTVTSGRGPAAAQLPRTLWVSADAHPVFAFPRGEFGGSGIGVGDGSGFAAGAAVGSGPFGVYAEYQHVDFECAQCGELELDEEVRDAGWELGLLIRPGGFPFRLRPWVRGGLIRHQLQFTSGDESVASEPASGLGLGAGLAYPIFGPLDVTGAVGRHSYRANFDFDDEAFADRGSEVVYLTYRFGLAVRF
ncbi:MAG: hypothetical protein KY464_16645 [Gemmatimonadetes bacterium]|nr:hypothetical protein [Gemmatimonadota bacterium]